MTWWMYAISAALIWGLHYPLIGKAMTSASAITVYFIPNMLLMLTLPFWYKILIEDYKSVMQSSWDVKASVIAIMFTSILASVAVYKAIHGSNATLASLIEISYPIFVAIFAYFLFGENHLTHWSNVVGGLLILTGTALIIYKG